MRRLFSTALALFGALLSPALAQQPQRSECLAMANAAPRVMSVAYRPAAGSAGVEITYAGHS
ncbi:MAG: Zn-dependent hydrolase, partial [Pseudomonadota bacterium]